MAAPLVQVAVEPQALVVQAGLMAVPDQAVEVYPPPLVLAATVVVEGMR
jgi:hypothetical protein